MKKKIIFIIIFIMLISCGIFGYLKWYPKYKENNAKDEVSLKEITLKEDMIRVTCAKYGNYVDFVIGSVNNPNIDTYASTNCMIEFFNYTDEDILIKNVEFDYDININDTREFKFDRLNFDVTDKDNHIILTHKKGISVSKPEMSNGEISSSSGLPISSFNFRIKEAPSNDKFVVNIKNIKIISDKKIYNNIDHTSTFDIKIDGNYKYERKENPKQIVFYKNEGNGYKEINKYECSGECFEYAAQCFSYVDLTNGKMFIVDDNKAILYDMNKGVIGEYVTPLFTLYDRSDSQYKQKYFVGRKTQNGKYGIIDFDGNVIKEYIADSLGNKLICDINYQTYSLEDNLITIKKDNKYGITRINNNDLLIDYQFDDIRLYNDEYFKVKIGNLWYLYNFNNEKVINEGYKQIFMVASGILITQVDDYLYIKDYNGENIIADKIKVLSEYNDKACCGATYGINVFLDSANNNIIHIIVDNGKIDENEFIQYKYEYNIKEKILTKKDSSR